jgi:excisionase family DNA binding protein
VEASERSDVEDGRRLVLSVPEAARVLGISRAFAYELVARGDLPHLRFGRRIVVPCIALEALLTRASVTDREHGHGGETDPGSGAGEPASSVPHKRVGRVEQSSLFDATSSSQEA